MSLESEYGALTDYPAAEEQKYTQTTEFDGVEGHIQTKGLEQPPDFTALLEQFGYDPTEVRIVGHPRTSRWQTYDERWLTAYRFNIAPVTATSDAVDLEALVSKARKKPATATGPHWFVFQAGDQQLGKRSRDGSTEQIVDRYIQSVEAAKAEFKTLKRQGIEGIQLSFPGDCLEGNQSQKGQNLWLTQETITEQTRIFRRLLFHTIEELAPLTSEVLVTVVNGNHDQAQRTQNTYPGDGWATECAIAVSDALKLNEPAFGHVKVLVPDKWSGSMTVPVGDTAVTVAHGHQWTRNNAMTWWGKQAFHNQPAAGSQVLQHGHWHTWEVQAEVGRIRVSSPTFDCGSDYYRDRNGPDSRRGGLTYLLGAGEVSRMSLV